MTIEQHLRQEAVAPGSKTAPQRGSALILALALVIIANLAVFARCLHGYFLADDFVHIDYLHNSIPANWQALLANFYGNWMQAEGTTFYRPLITVTMASDYLLYGARASGYHLTNLLFQIAASLFLLLLTKELTERMLPYLSARQTLFFAALCALAFSLSPLHGEVVNWIIARVDSVALTFSLLSLWTFLLPPSSKLRKISLLAFIAALMSKEMAITVPPAAAAIVFFTSEKQGLKARVIESFKQTKFFWLMLLVYLGFRTIALGTISGGYTGSIGEGLSSSLLKRWTDGSLLKLFFPFNQEIFGAKHSLYKELKVLYLAGALGFIIYLFRLEAAKRTASLKYLSFALVWLVLSLLPTYQVWNLNDNLQGARFAYFATAPVALLTSLVVFSPLFSRAALSRFAATIITLLLFSVFVSTTTANNSNWIHAQRELQRFRQAVEEAVDKVGAKAGAQIGSGKIAVLNIPQSYKGAHMLYNAATMSVMLRPPLSKDLSGKVYTFEPATFGDSELLSTQRLKTLSYEMPIFFWDRSAQKLVPLSLKEEKHTEKELTLFNGEAILEKDRAFLSPPLSVSPLDFDLAHLTFKEPLKMDSPIVLKATGLDGTAVSFNARAAQETKEIDIQLSERKGWFSHGNIVSLSLSGNGQTLTALKLCRLDAMPEIKPTGGLAFDPDGICRLKGANPAFSYDVSMVKGARGAAYELSRANAWFEHYSGTRREKGISKEAAVTGSFSNTKGSIVQLSAVGVKGHGFFELKVAAADENGNPIGYFSEPLSFQL